MKAATISYPAAGSIDTNSMIVAEIRTSTTRDIKLIDKEPSRSKKNRNSFSIVLWTRVSENLDQFSFGSEQIRSGEISSIINKMNTSLMSIGAQYQAAIASAVPNFCALPAEHHHSFAPLNLLELFDEDDGQQSDPRSDKILSILADVNATYNGANQLDRSASVALHDPYIDAVQVKSRVNNKRGPRVKALPSPDKQQAASADPNQAAANVVQQQPSQQYAKEVKTVQVKETEHSYDEYGDSSDDDDDDDDDDHGKGKGKRKKIYIKTYITTTGDDGAHYLGGGYHQGHGKHLYRGKGYGQYKGRPRTKSHGYGKNYGHLQQHQKQGYGHDKHQHGGYGRGKQHGYGKGHNSVGPHGGYDKGNKGHGHQHHGKGQHYNNHHHQKNHYNQHQKPHQYQIKGKKVTYAYVIQPVIHNGNGQHNHHMKHHHNYQQQQNHYGHKGQHHGQHHGKGMHQGYNNYGHKGNNHGYDQHHNGYQHGKGNGYHHEQHYGKGGGYGKGGHYNQNQNYGHGKYHQMQNNHHNKGGLTISGLLGYTLLCVNYLLILQQPGYNKYSNGYSKYSPGHSAKGHGGEMVAVKAGGPIILAHCGELGPPQTGVSKYVAAASSTSGPQGAGRAPRAAASYSPEVTASASSQSPQYARALDKAANSPPAYYYYTPPVGGTQQQPEVATATNATVKAAAAELFPNRVLLPARADGPDEQPWPIQVVRGPPPTRIRLTASSEGGRPPSDDDPSIQRRRQLFLSTQAGALGPLGGAFNAQLILSSGSGGGGSGFGPQVVRARDNLAGQRMRPLGLRVRVTARSRGPLGVGARRPVTLSRNNEPEDDSDWVLVAGRGGNLGQWRQVMMQNDEPARPLNSSSGSSATGSGDTRQPNNILDLPDYALSGDSIELTCNHRMPTNRLYSVKWFKDSLEFYRFIPANGPRAKSSLFLPDVRLDLTRSNSESIYLRNVTHRSGGLYRCEVVSALPESGPQLSLLERGPSDRQQQSPQPLLSPLLQTIVPLLSTQREAAAFSWVGQNQEPQQPSLPVGGPLVRCVSARANPAAQLKFFINDRPIGLERTVENSTLGYSDGLESNVASFRLQISDFGLSGGQQLVAAAAQSSGAGQRVSVAGESLVKTTTTTTTTVKPHAPNAEVNFDDQNLPVKREDFKEMLAKRRSEASSSAASGSSNELSEPEDKKRTDRKWNGKRAAGFVDKDSGSSLDEVAERESRPLTIAADPPLPVRQRDNAETRQRKLLRPTVGVANYVPPTDAAGDRSETEKLESAQVGARSKEDILTRRDAAQLTSMAANQQQVSSSQRRRVARQQQQQQQSGQTTTNSNSNDNQIESENSGRTSNEPVVLYSNYIRIKCTSLVPAVGYEMTSELNVPLTLLVPASQLSEVTGARSTGSSSGSGGATLQQRGGLLRGGQQPATGSGSSGGQEAGSNSTQRAISGLQSPRAVLIDRIAQASAPQVKATTSAATSTGLVRGTGAQNRTSAQNATSSTMAPRANIRKQQSTRDRALEQRGKYLDELGKRSGLNSASSGAISNLSKQLSSGFVVYQLIVALASALWQQSLCLKRASG